MEPINRDSSAEVLYKGLCPKQSQMMMSTMAGKYTFNCLRVNRINFHARRISRDFFVTIKYPMINITWQPHL